MQNKVSRWMCQLRPTGRQDGGGREGWRHGGRREEEERGRETGMERKREGKKERLSEGGRDRQTDRQRGTEYKCECLYGRESGSNKVSGQKWQKVMCFDSLFSVFCVSK